MIIRSISFSFRFLIFYRYQKQVDCNPNCNVFFPYTSIAFTGIKYINLLAINFSSLPLNELSFSKQFTQIPAFVAGPTAAYVVISGNQY